MQPIDNQTRVLIFSLKPEDLPMFDFKDAEQKQFNVVKGLQKFLRSNAAAMIILHINNNESEKAAQQLAEYVRQSLANGQIKIIALVTARYNTDDMLLIEKYAIDELITVQANSTPLINARLNRALDVLKLTQDTIQQKAAQTDLLMSVNRFTRHRQSIQSLIIECAQALGNFCCSTSAIVAFPSKTSTVKLKENLPELTQSQLKKLKENGLSSIINQSFTRTSPNVDLLTNSTLTAHLNTIYNQSIGSYLVFPLTVYGKTLAVIFCFITDNDMHRVSTQHLNVMRDTAEQLRLVLERRGAENRLKAQYHRLKSTLSELQTTQDQLLHSEKMASVGQMAAGIAHEINNPLSSVLSNFDPLNEYVATLVKMLELHDTLVESIDSPDDTAKQKVKHIETLREESDLNFIMDDVKAIVNDSREGLLRVRDIISDLNSFSHKQELERKTFYLNDLLSETLRLLKTEITDDILIAHETGYKEPLTAHRGFVQQILTNLIKNAAQALSTSESAGKNKSIQINAHCDENNAYISVEDNGPGIKDDLKKQIFSPFFTTKSVGQGTGLGLSVSYNLAKKMGGSLSLDNQSSRATIFTLQLPLAYEE
jgi:C4-dicarboxylate-specific signal transduction histidine kinase